MKNFLEVGKLYEVKLNSSWHTKARQYHEGRFYLTESPYPGTFPKIRSSLKVGDVFVVLEKISMGFDTELDSRYWGFQLLTTNGKSGYLLVDESLPFASGWYTIELVQ